MFPLKAFYWGHKGARDNFALQIRNIVQEAYQVLGETPVIIGECGIPMDMKWVIIDSPQRLLTFSKFIAKEKRFKPMISRGKRK